VTSPKMVSTYGGRPPTQLVNSPLISSPARRIVSRKVVAVTSLRPGNGMEELEGRAKRAEERAQLAEARVKTLACMYDTLRQRVDLLQAAHSGNVALLDDFAGQVKLLHENYQEYTTVLEQKLRSVEERLEVSLERENAARRNNAEKSAKDEALIAALADTVVCLSDPLHRCDAGMPRPLDEIFAEVCKAGAATESPELTRYESEPSILTNTTASESKVERVIRPRTHRRKVSGPMSVKRRIEERAMEFHRIACGLRAAKD